MISSSCIICLSALNDEGNVCPACCFDRSVAEKNGKDAIAWAAEAARGIAEAKLRKEHREKCADISGLLTRRSFLTGMALRVRDLETGEEIGRVKTVHLFNGMIELADGERRPGRYEVFFKVQG